MGAAEEDLAEARRVLLPPLRFAARDDFANLDRLKGVAKLADNTLGRLAGLSTSVRDRLKTLAEAYDDSGMAERRRLVAAALEVLAEPGEQPAAQTETQVDSSESAEPSRPGPERPGLERPGPARSRPAPRGRAISPPIARQAVSDLLLAPVTTLSGVGPAKARALDERGLRTVGDLLYTIPRAYEDRRSVRPIAKLETGLTSVIEGEVKAAGQVGRGRGGRFEVQVDDGTGRLKLVFFRFKPWDMKRRFAPGATVTAVGEVQRYGGGLQMAHPIVAQGERSGEMSGIWPVYSELRGMHPAELRRFVRAAVRLLEARPVRDLVPGYALDDADLPDINEALLALHAPSPNIDEATLARLSNRRTRAHLRLAFDEVFVLQLALGLKRRRETEIRARAVAAPPPAELAEAILPFTPTRAQWRAAEEVLADLARPHPMGRLLQGDVGAGKTAVAAMAALAVVRDGGQVAIMAPTEILAEQHHATFQQWFSPLGVRVDLVTGGGRSKARRLKLARLNHGEIQIAVGTHALLSDDVGFKKLRLAVIDEQHRFGVVQRLELARKGPVEDGRPMTPHVLVMTATPIPRSLALTVYGDLAVSVLDELPPGRTPVKTKVLRGAGEELAYEAVRELIARGEKAFVVYPLIEESEKLDLADATRGFEDLSKRFGPERIALLHGRIPTNEREAVMERFVRGEVSVLVSTTVIEVGVDVPDATCMIVQHGERFGLSQLHQLRGRVGRSSRPSRCFLIVGEDGAGKDGYRRLKVMEQTNDGFKIAEEDLAIRGPGDFLGTRQHGLPTFAFADLTKHAALIERARAITERILEEDPALEDAEHADLRTLVFERFADRLALAGVG